nr:hypothetical protein [Neobacillus sp. Marseille-Q6967]
MKVLIKTISILLSLCLTFLLFAFSSQAAELDRAPKKDKTNTYALDKKNAVWDEELQAYVIPLKKVNGQLQPVSPDIYLNEISTLTFEKTDGLYSEESTTDVVYPNADYREWYEFTPTSISDLTGSTKKVTADIYCSATNGCRIDKSVGVTVSASYSVSLTAEKDAIKANAGFTWVNSASDTSVYSFSIAYGDRGYIGFRPYLKRTYGTLKKYSNWDGYLSSKTAYGYSPKKTYSGEADGYYYFVYTN